MENKTPQCTCDTHKTCQIHNPLTDNMPSQTTATEDEKYRSSCGCLVTDTKVELCGQHSGKPPATEQEWTDVDNKIEALCEKTDKAMPQWFRKKLKDIFNAALVAQKKYYETVRYRSLIEHEAKLADELATLRQELYETRKEIAFWAGEGQSDRPEIIEWRKLAEIKRPTKAQIKRMGEIARQIEAEDMDLPELQAALSAEREKVTILLDRAAIVEQQLAAERENSTEARAQRDWLIKECARIGVTVNVAIGAPNTEAYRLVNEARKPLVDLLARVKPFIQAQSLDKIDQAKAIMREVNDALAKVKP